VAYRFFGTQHRKFIVADTPGHEQYTRNMVTGASTADVAVILVDASQGLLTQTRRHSFLTSMLGISHVVLAINKMDLVDYQEQQFIQIVDQYQDFAQQLAFKNITPIALSALYGDNVIERSSRMPWYQGPTLLSFLETVEVSRLQNDHGFRFPVQWVNRPNAKFRGFTGAVAAGSIIKGGEVIVMPSGQRAAIQDIVLFKDHLDQALAGQSVTLTLDREVDVSRGDVIVASDDVCDVSDQFDTSLVWMDADKGYVGRSYWLMLGAVRINASFTEIKYKHNVNSLEQMPTRSLALNDIGRVTLSLDRAIPYEAYSDCPSMGSFILMDRYTNRTVAAGMINFGLRRAQNLYPQTHSVNAAARSALMGHEAKVFWFTGLSGSGKSTVADAFEKALHARGIHSYILDGDNIRTGLNKDLGFTNADRVENIRRTAEMAKLMKDAGLVVITAFISPFRSERDMARALFGDNEFVEVFVDVSLHTAEERDPKGLYRKARQGQLPHFTGIDSPYEAPQEAELVLNTAILSVDQCVDKLMTFV
jgi:bifunctional enzyme CysN/CysC